jgi:spore coat polysaccharide biosynthesis predicted glycosyltransferase SpsG
MTRAVVLTTADPEIGLGHLYRCDALAQAFAQTTQIETKLVVSTTTGADWLYQRAPTSSYEIANWNHEPDIARKYIQGADMVVVDSYDIDSAVWQAIEAAASLPVFFDDTGTNIPARGVIINGTPGAHLVNYPTNNKLTLLLGTDYQVLRPPFWHKPNRTVSETVGSLGVMLGGTDHGGLMQHVLDLVIETLPRSVHIYAIGSDAPSGYGPRVTCTGRLTAAEVKKLFDKIDLLVTAAGQTVAEAVSCQLPTVMIQTADNQALNLQGWQELGIGFSSGAAWRSDFASTLSKNLVQVLNETTRKRFVRNAASVSIDESTQHTVSALAQLVTSYEQI